MCTDGKRYVVKFKNNPQGKRILVNELLAFSLAKYLGLPIQHFGVIVVPQKTIRKSWEQMFVETTTGQTPLAAGRCFGSEYAGPELAATDAFIKWNLEEIQNIQDFWGMLVFDLWTCNTDFRQVLRFKNGGKYWVKMIDNGHCFSGRKWKFRDASVLALFWNRAVYKDVTGIQSFDPWLSKIEQMDDSVLGQAAQAIPREWYGSSFQAIECLITTLANRKHRVRGQLLRLREQHPLLFPRWTTLAEANFTDTPNVAASTDRKELNC
jgi:hypothetical protein